VRGLTADLNLSTRSKMSLLQGTNIAQSKDVTGIRRRYSYEPYQEYIKYLKDIAINLRDKSPQLDLLSSAKQELKAFSMWADGLRKVLVRSDPPCSKGHRSILPPRRFLMRKPPSMTDKKTSPAINRGSCKTSATCTSL
jgi:hypothetical protein